MGRLQGTTLGEVGEIGVIDCLRRLLPAGSDVVVGAGDDCAVVRAAAEWDWVLGSDPITEGVHFLANDSSEAIGRKAVGRVLSDLAAMGAAPAWALVDVVAPASLLVERLESCYRGLVDLAERYGLAVVGGDLSEGDKLSLHVFAAGRVPQGTALLRGGAQVGDVLFVSGELGGSREGGHLAFEPRVAEGHWLREGKWASAAMDLSDGLGVDLSRLVHASGVGAEVRIADMPVASVLDGLGRDEARQRALTEGEDYELVFTVAPSRARAMQDAWERIFDIPCTAIGEISDGDGVWIVDAAGKRLPVMEQGFLHFAEES